ncbi:MAG: trimethylamine methyltransferase family protein [Thermoleophilia bacterium]
MSGTLTIRPLSAGEVALIFEKCVAILSGHGVKVDHREALERLRAAGADVDPETSMVRFSPATIDDALRSVPHSFTAKGADPRHDLALPHPAHSFFTSSCIQSMVYHDPDTGQFRDNSRALFAEWCQLIEVLPNIDSCAIQTPMDVPTATADIHALNIQLQNTGKPLNVLAYCRESVPYLFELLLARAGSAEALRERPLLWFDPTSLSPLVYKEMDLETILLCCKYGIPVSPCSLVLGGGTGPITPAGAALLVGVEVLAMLVMTQLLAPGHPVLASGYNSTLDMATGNANLASVETGLAQAAAAQFMKEAFAVPVLMASLWTDSYVSDGQTVMAKSLNATLCGMAGADIAYGAGRLGGSTLASPVQLVIDDRATALLRRYVAGVEVDEEALGVDAILTAGAGGHYLKQKHTLKHCREAVRPDIFVADPLDAWQTAGSKDLYERAAEKYRELRATLRPLELPDDVRRDMDAVVARADAHLAS